MVYTNGCHWWYGREEADIEWCSKSGMPYGEFAAYAQKLHVPAVALWKWKHIYWKQIYRFFMYIYMPCPPTCAHYLMPYFCFQILLSWSQPAIFILKNICSWIYQPISVNKNILIMHIYITVHFPRLGLSHKSVCTHTPMLWTDKFYPISSTSHSLWMKSL